MAFGNWTGLSSSHLTATRFDTESGTLQIEFKGGAVYEWYGVQEDSYTELTQAPSPGRFLNANIHGLYGVGHRV